MYKAEDYIHTTQKVSPKLQLGGKFLLRKRVDKNFI